MSISFSANVKTELCKAIPANMCCTLAECFGILLFCNHFSAENIRIITECREFAQNLPKLFQKAFNVSFDSFPSLEAPGKLIFQVQDSQKIHYIMSCFGFSAGDTVALHINFPILEEDCCKAAFLRGAFLAGGSVTDPIKGYHMELTTSHPFVARECVTVMQEALGFYPKTAQRSGGQVLYLKQSEQISDFLTFMGAPVAAMGIMEARLEKELNNKVNRRCNCDDANTTKVVEAAQEQLAAIRKIQQCGMEASLPKKLQQAYYARLSHPESSLSELAMLMEPPITKPAMNHRLKKLVELAKEAAQ